MKDDKPEQTTVNDRGTRAASDRNLTDGRSGPVRYELIDKDEKVAARHSDAGWLVDRAREFWPDQQQDPDHTGAGWDVRAIASAPDA